MICEKCGYEERDGAFFCRNCGKLLDPAGYSSKSVYETEEHRIMRMVENLKHHPHYDILWDDTMDLYAAKVEKFQSILGTGVDKQGTNAYGVIKAAEQLGFSAKGVKC